MKKTTSAKRLLCCCLLLTLILSLFAGCNVNVTENNDKDIVILYTNDVHCAVSDNIGYSGLSYLKNELEKDNYTALVDCGDSIQGAFIGAVSDGGYIISIMNEMDYDIAIPGNHEFDYGMDAFLKCVESADFPYICCNLTRTADGSNVLSSYKILEYGKVKVGFVGVITPNTVSSASPATFYNENNEYAYDFGDGDDGAALYGIIQNTVDEARKAGADYVIALSHLGDIDAFKPYRSVDVIEHTTGIDAVLDAHSHSVVECRRVKNADGEYVLLSQTGTKLQNVGMLVITKSGNISTGLVSGVEGSDEAVENAIAAIEADFQQQLNEVIAYSDYDLSIYEGETRISRTGETSLGDLITDAFRYYGDTDICIINGGSIRESLKKGDITYSQIYAVAPFGNTAVTIEATGAQIRDALEMGAANYPGENGSFMCVAGMSYELDPSVPSSVVIDDKGLFVEVAGDYRVKNIKVGGEDIDLNKTYTVASTDYLLLEQGDGLTMFDGCKVIKDEGYLDVDTIIDYIVNVLGGNIGSEYSNNHGEGRIIID